MGQSVLDRKSDHDGRLVPSLVVVHEDSIGASPVPDLVVAVAVVEQHRGSESAGCLPLPVDFRDHLWPYLEASVKIGCSEGGDYVVVAVFGEGLAGGGRHAPLVEVDCAPRGASVQVPQ